MLLLFILQCPGQVCHRSLSVTMLISCRHENEPLFSSAHVERHIVAPVVRLSLLCDYHQASSIQHAGSLSAAISLSKWHQPPVDVLRTSHCPAWHRPSQSPNSKPFSTSLAPVCLPSVTIWSLGRYKVTQSFFMTMQLA